MRVIVLGAGIIGASIADALARRGVEVLVLDMRSPGQGASSASAGMLAPYAEGHGDTRLQTLLVRSLALYDDYIAGLASDTGQAIEYARTGTLEVALNDDGATKLEAAKRELNAAGVAADLISGRDLAACEPALSTSARAGLITHSQGFVGVATLMSALVNRARFSGAVFETGVEAANVEATRDAAVVEASGRHYHADVAVVAAGSWSKRVRVKHVAALPVRPVRGQLLQLRWTTSQRPRRIVWGPECYTVPWSDGTLLVGATLEEAGFDEHATVAGVESLTNAVAKLLPGAGSAELQAVRVGLRPALPDSLPAIGPLTRAPRVVVATGHYRNGVLLAPLTAEIVTRHIVDGIADSAFEWTTPDRFLS